MKSGRSTWRKLRAAVRHYCAEPLERRCLLSGVSFQAAMPLEVGFIPQCVISADFNADGKPDLAVVARAREYPKGDYGIVSILLNNGDGTFAARVDYDTNYWPMSLTSGDFNADGKMDLAVIDGAVCVFLGNGDGTFAAKVDYAAGDFPDSVTCGDFNADGRLDLAVSNGSSNTVSILLNNGDGTFAGKVDYDTGTNPECVTSGDFNADGKLDLITANYNSNTVSVLLGNSDGTFAAKVDYATGSAPGSITCGDFNADGKPDLAIANQDYANWDGGTVSILLNNGDGTFAAKVDYDTGRYPRSVTRLCLKTGV